MDDPRAPRPHTKLTPEKVVQLREDYAAGVSQTTLATRYGIWVGGISLIVRGKKWKRAGGPIAPTISRSDAGKRAHAADPSPTRDARRLGKRQQVQRRLAMYLSERFGSEDGTAQEAWDFEAGELLRFVADVRRDPG